MAGALYGIGAVPAPWLDELHASEAITERAEALFCAAFTCSRTHC